MIGIELGQFAIDPFGSGVQRVLQQLAHQWPEDTPAEFLIPTEVGFGALNAYGAYRVLSTTFESRPADHEASALIAEKSRSLFVGERRFDELAKHYSSWLVPEMTYNPGILQRIRAVQEVLPVTMVAYDALPMSHPENYHFTPGTHGNVSEYLRILRDAPTVICISEFTRQQMIEVLRRPGNRPTLVAHPGGDHIPVSESHPPSRPRFLRVGTMEARKQPVEIVSAFMAAVDDGLKADLEFIGSPSRVDVSINMAVQRAVDDGYPVTWRKCATDADVADAMATSTALLSYGIEGYGIPILEAIRRSLPVLFDGVQPTGEIMDGRGATRVPLDATRAAWLGMLDSVDRSRAAMDPDAVPRWVQFAETVVEASR